MSAMQQALEEVYGGDQSLEASAVEDKLYDRGRVVVPVGFTYELPEPSVPRRRWSLFAVALLVIALALMVLDPSVGVAI